MIHVNLSTVYLQRWDALADWLGVFSEDAFFIQELAFSPIASWLEKPIVEHIFQALIKCTKDPLLGNPDRCIRVEAHAFLVGFGAQQRGRGNM